MVKPTASALLFVVAALNVASTAAIPVGNSASIAERALVQERGLGDEIPAELSRRAKGGAKSSTKSTPPPAANKAPVNNNNNRTPVKTPNTNNNRKPSNTPNTNNRKPTNNRTPNKPAPLDQNNLLKEQFDLEQMRVGLEKQEQQWKPTVFKRGEEYHELVARARGSSKTPSTSKPPPTTNNKTPATNNKTPTTNNKTPTTNNKTPTTNNKTPTTNNKAPTNSKTPTNNKTPTTNNKTPTTNNKTPNTNNKTPNTNKKTPNTNNRTPNTNNRTPNTNGKPQPNQVKTPAAPPIDNNALLKEQFKLEEMRVALEKQEQQWKPTVY